MPPLTEQTFCAFGWCGILFGIAILVTLIVGVVRVEDIRHQLVSARPHTRTR